MAKRKTNFAYLMDLLEISTASFCEVVQVNKSSVSRWRSGERKIKDNKPQIQVITEYFYQEDLLLQNPILKDVLASFYPTESLETKEEIISLLQHWLTTEAMESPEVKTSMFQALENLGKTVGVKKKSISAKKVQELLDQNTFVGYGEVGIQQCAMKFLDFLMLQKEPQEILYSCAEGIEALTKDEAFATKLMEKLLQVFKKGHRLTVVMRTDFRVSTVSAFSGKWLVAHILGYIRSFYFDDFVTNYDEKMIVVVKDIIGIQVKEIKGEESVKLISNIFYDKNKVNEFYTKLSNYEEYSSQRFLYHYFENPQHFLKDKHIDTTHDFYAVTRLPIYSVMDVETLSQALSLSDEEFAYLQDEFSFLFNCAISEDTKAITRYILCIDDIEEAIHAHRKLVYPLSKIFNRHVYIEIQVIVDCLAKLLNEVNNKNIEVCFLSNSIFKELQMEIVVRSYDASVAWIRDISSTACKDYINSSTLTGFCTFVWNKVPSFMRSERSASRKLLTLLKEAKRLGYEVDNNIFKS